MQRVSHFEIHADNPERAAKFYQDVFNWKIEKYADSSMDYWLVITGDKKDVGINGGIGGRNKNMPTTSFISYIDVASVDKILDKIKSSGGKVVTPKTEIPKVGWFAVCKDTDNNMFGVIEMSPEGMAEMQKNQEKMEKM